MADAGAINPYSELADLSAEEREERLRQLQMQALQDLSPTERQMASDIFRQKPDELGAYYDDPSSWLAQNIGGDMQTQGPSAEEIEAKGAADAAAQRKLDLMQMGSDQAYSGGGAPNMKTLTPFRDIEADAEKANQGEIDYGLGDPMDPAKRAVPQALADQDARLAAIAQGLNPAQISAGGANIRAALQNFANLSEEEKAAVQKHYDASVKALEMQSNLDNLQGEIAVKRGKLQLEHQRAMEKEFEADQWERQQYMERENSIMAEQEEYLDEMSDEVKYSPGNLTSERIRKLKDIEKNGDPEESAAATAELRKAQDMAPQFNGLEKASLIIGGFASGILSGMQGRDYTGWIDRHVEQRAQMRRDRLQAARNRMGDAHRKYNRIKEKLGSEKAARLQMQREDVMMLQMMNASKMAELDNEGATARLGMLGEALGAKKAELDAQLKSELTGVAKAQAARELQVAGTLDQMSMQAQQFNAAQANAMRMQLQKSIAAYQTTAKGKPMSPADVRQAAALRSMIKTLGGTRDLFKKLDKTALLAAAAPDGVFDTDYERYKHNRTMVGMFMANALSGATFTDQQAQKFMEFFPHGVHRKGPGLDKIDAAKRVMQTRLTQLLDAAESQGQDVGNLREGIGTFKPLTMEELVGE